MKPTGPNSDLAALLCRAWSDETAAVMAAIYFAYERKLSRPT